MKRFKFKSQELALVVLCMALGLSAGSAGAQDTLIWPIEGNLVYNDANNRSMWHETGTLSIWNDRNDLKISIETDGVPIRVMNIHVVQDTGDFDSLFDKNKNPKPSRFDYRMDYETESEVMPDFHDQVISLDNFDICWGVDPVKCPPNLYVLVVADLMGIPENAFARSPLAYEGMEDNGVFYGWFVTYPLAKVDPGHFVDANVNGLMYRTPTQSGTTGSEGQFWFLPDEWVEFSAGNLYLGDALAQRRVSPVELFDDASDLENDKVLNVARLLQSFDGDGNPAQGAINLTEPVIGCLNSVLAGLPEPLPPPELFFAYDDAVGALIDATIAACADQIVLTAVSKEEALENLNRGMQAANLMKRNISKTPGMASDKAKIEIMPVYVPAQRPDGSLTDVVYYDAEGEEIETRNVAKPIVVAYLDEVEGAGVADVYVAVSRDDGDSWKRRNVSKTADKSSLVGYPGTSQKPMLKVKDNMIFVAWTDKYCRGGRPGYAITVCPDTNGDGLPDPCEICRESAEGTTCTIDYPGDDAYWQDDLFGAAGPQRSVTYDDYPEMGEVPYSCAWTARAVIEPNGMIQWFKPERVTSGRRDAFQLFAGAGQDVAFGIVWQEDPRGLMPGEGDGPGDGWSGANTHNKADVWYSYITMDDFGKIDYAYPAGGHGDGDLVDDDPELAGRVKALVPMSLPVRVSDNEVCSAENMDPDGGHGEHDFDGEGEGTHRYCGTVEAIGTAAEPGSNPLCAYTLEKANPRGEIHHVCVTADGRLLDGNTGASRPNLFLQPYKKTVDGEIIKSAWAIIGYEESKGVGTPPEGDHDEDPCGTDDGTDDGVDDHDVTADDGHDDDRYKPDMGKNVIYHSFDFANPVTVAAGGILNLPETDAVGNPVYLVDEFGDQLLDWKGEPQLAYENARRVRFISQPKSKAGASKTVLVALYRQGEEGSGKPADVFVRRVVAPSSGNPYAFENFEPGAQNVSSVEPTELWQHPFDADKPVKMLRWGWSHDNLADSSAKNPYTDARAHRGALVGDELLIGYTWTPNWGRRANDKYDLYVLRSFNGGQSWTTDPADLEPIEHSVVFRVPVLDEVNQIVTWDEEVVTTAYEPGHAAPPRNVSNVRNNRVSVLEPRLVKAPGTITDPNGGYPEDVQDIGMYQLAYGLEFNQNQLPDDVVYPKMPLDIYYSRTRDKGQRYESVIVTPQGGTGRPKEGWNPLARELSEEGAVQVRQTPDGSRMYAVWLERGEGGNDVMFRRVDYR